MRTLWRAGLIKSKDREGDWAPEFTLYLEQDDGSSDRVALRDGDSHQAISDSLRGISFDLTFDVVSLIMEHASRDRKGWYLSLELLKKEGPAILLELHRHCFRNQMRHFHVCGTMDMEDAHQLIDEHYVEDVMEA